MKVLVIDIGGASIKLLATGRRKAVALPSGPRLTPKEMMAGVRAATRGWRFDAVSIGYPGAVVRNRVVAEPHNLGPGWTRYDFRRAFGRPVRIVNDAVMQALGSYRGGRMLFLGLGTGLGAALILDGVPVPLEIAHLPYRDGRSYEEYVGDAGLARLGLQRWRRHVAIVVGLLRPALQADYVVLGGGNVRLLDELPAGAQRGDNANAFRGGFRLWARPVPDTPARGVRGLS